MTMNFFRNFGAYVLLGKNTLKTRKRLPSDDHTGKQGLVPRFLSYKSYRICKKNYLQINFMQFVEIKTDLHTFRKGKKRDF